MRRRRHGPLLPLRGHPPAPPVGPLSGYLDEFAQKLSEHGYAIDTGSNNCGRYPI